MIPSVAALAIPAIKIGRYGQYGLQGCSLSKHCQIVQQIAFPPLAPPVLCGAEDKMMPAGRSGSPTCSCSLLTLLSPVQLRQTITIKIGSSCHAVRRSLLRCCPGWFGLVSWSSGLSADYSD